MSTEPRSGPSGAPRAGVVRPRPAESLSERMGLREPIVELGPSHPSMRRTLAATGTTLGFLVTLDDDRIRALEVEIGLGHRGFEKEAESGSWLRALPYVRRLAYAGAPIAEVAYCLGVEALAGLDVPERAVWLRTLGCELARVTDHFARLAAVAAAIGLPAAGETARRGLVRAGALLGRVVGGGPLEAWSCPGGVLVDGAPALIAVWSDARADLVRILERYASLGVRPPGVRARLRGVAPLAADACEAWNVTGPALRAAGVAADERRDRPVLAYDRVDFDVPVGAHGDDEDRLRVVVEEIRQALHIADQCLAELAVLGVGATRIDDPAWRWPEPRQGDGGRGGAAAADVDVDGPTVPVGEVEVGVEAPTGALGFLLVSDGGTLPRRIRCRAPSFFHAQALPAMLEGAWLDDILPTAALMHIVTAECDR